MQLGEDCVIQDRRREEIAQAVERYVVRIQNSVRTDEGRSQNVAVNVQWFTGLSRRYVFPVEGIRTNRTDDLSIIGVWRLRSVR